VDAGSKLVEEAGSTINDIVASVKRVTDIAGDISSASEEQSTGVEQVNAALSQLDQVTQQNAALVEEASAATQSMAQQARELRGAVAVFRITDSALSAPEWLPPERTASKRPSGRQTPTYDVEKGVATHVPRQGHRIWGRYRYYGLADILNGGGNWTILKRRWER
jgi:hypothetical protein